MNGPSKMPKEDRNRAAQIKAALKKCNPDILDRINKGNSALENEEQIDNPFDANRDKPNADDVTEDIENSESSLSSRMASSSPGQYSRGRIENSGPWDQKACIFVQALDIPEKIMGKKVGWIYNLLKDVRYFLGAVMARNQEIRVDFSQVAGRDQAREILANNEIESFLMTTDGVNIQMAEVGAAMREFGEVNKIQIRVAGKWQSAVVEYNNQEEATRTRKTWEAKLIKSKPDPASSQELVKITQGWAMLIHNNATKKPLVIDDILVHWMSTDAKECHFCYQVGHLVSKCPTLHKKKKGDTKKVTNNIRLAKLYVKRNVPEENIKNNTNPNNTQKPGPQKAEIDELRQQVDKMAKLLSAIAAKFEITIEKEKELIKVIIDLINNLTIDLTVDLIINLINDLINDLIINLIIDLIIDHF
ncbi:hypothetical protein G9A89_012781 [Geosiphon pyriformis]|nr:hypothetical protein G9A89_012781 [Geosiphon pyriformis]